jgi:ribosome biogenesis GTPase A
LQDLVVFSIKFLEENYPERLKERYKLDAVPENVVEMFDQIGELRGCLGAGGIVDYDKVSELVIREIRSEKFGPLTFERPSDIVDKSENK